MISSSNERTPERTGENSSAWPGVHYKRIVGFACLIFSIDFFLYFRHAGHFFQADSVFLLYNRANSITELLLQFTRVNPSGAYRPLSLEIFESILYPIFGLNPIPHRIPVYFFFLATTCAVYALAWVVSRRNLVAAFATFFFSIHTASAYTTYDIGFLPELQYTLFYIGAVLAEIRYLQSGSKLARRLSIGCFVASLLSKEAGVTLPGTLFVVHILMGKSTGTFISRSLQSARSLLGHVVVLIAFLAYAVGYLHTMGFEITKAFEKPEKPDPASYQMVIDSNVLANVDLAVSWAFNIPKGFFGSWHHPAEWMTTFLKAFRLLVLALAGLAVLRGWGKIVLLGLLWFVLTMIPTLPLLNHFIPYYLFLPVVGVSLVVGVGLTCAYDLISKLRPSIAAIALSLILALLLYVRHEGTRPEIRDNDLLGLSAELALSSLNEFTAMFPTLPPKVTIYIDDRTLPLAWHHSNGGLLKMAYGREDISVLYASNDEAPIPGERLDSIVLTFENRHLIDRTAEYIEDFTKFVQLNDTGTYRLELSAPEAIAGSGRYSMSIPNAPHRDVRVAYRLDDGPVEMFLTKLDGQGETGFDVGADTKKGLYRYVAFNILGESQWNRTDVSIRIR